MFISVHENGPPKYYHPPCSFYKTNKHSREKFFYSAFAECGSSITILIWFAVETRHGWVPRNVGWKLSWCFFLSRSYDTKTFYGLKLATLNTWCGVNYFSQSFPEAVQSCFFLVQYRPTPGTELSEVVMQKKFQCVGFVLFFQPEVLQSWDLCLFARIWESTVCWAVDADPGSAFI